MTFIPPTSESSLPTWRRLPVTRRRRLAVLIGQLAWRQLDPKRPAPKPTPGEEEVHDHHPADGQD